MPLHMALFVPFLTAGEYSVVYMYHIFFIHSSVDGHLACFHVLISVNSCNEHWAAYIFFKFGFLRINTQE